MCFIAWFREKTGQNIVWQKWMTKNQIMRTGKGLFSNHVKRWSNKGLISKFMVKVETPSFFRNDFFFHLRVLCYQSVMEYSMIYMRTMVELDGANPLDPIFE